MHQALALDRHADVESGAGRSPILAEGSFFVPSPWAMADNNIRTFDTAPLSLRQYGESFAMRWSSPGGCFPLGPVPVLSVRQVGTHLSADRIYEPRAYVLVVSTRNA